MKQALSLAVSAVALAVAVFALTENRTAGQASGQAGGQPQASTDPMPGTKLGVDALKAQFFHVSAGRRLKPKAWPNGARVAVALGFDVDNASANLARGD